jgi:hypothetical protein
VGIRGVEPSLSEETRAKCSFAQLVGERINNTRRILSDGHIRRTKNVASATVSVGMYKVAGR